MSKTEYAKLMRWYTPDCNGVKTTVTLPTNLADPLRTKIGGGKANGFINFYLSVDGILTNGGLNHVECGLSTNYANQGNKWHWMYTWKPEDSKGGDYVYNPGQAIPIEVSLSANKASMDFWVNGSIVKSFPGPYSTLKQVRLVVAACDQDYVKYDANRKIVPDLPSNGVCTTWNTYHNQVVCSNYQYKNGSTWTTCTASNSTPPTPFGSGQSSAEVHWPEGNWPHVGAPLGYTFQVSSGQLVASVKKV